jgi:hypothetical protein
MRDAPRTVAHSPARGGPSLRRQGTLPPRPAPVGHYPSVLSDLLHDIQTMHEAGRAQDEIISRIYDIAAVRGLRVCHDQHDLREPTAAPKAILSCEAEEGPQTPLVLDETSQPDDEQAPVCITEQVLLSRIAEEKSLALAPLASNDEKEEERSLLKASHGGTAPKASAGSAGRPKRERREKKTNTIPAPVIRQKDGSLILAIGKIFDGAPAPAFGALPDEDLAGWHQPPSRDATVGRLMLCGEARGGRKTQNAAGGDTVLAYECNGLVLDARTWRALAVPPGAFNHRPPTKTVDALLAEGVYDVIRVDDGTVVTLYHWDHPLEGPVWCLSTSNGYDVSSLLWMGGLTFAEIFFDLATRAYPDFCKQTGIALKKGPGDVTRLTFLHLDPHWCYTVGFRHHDFHPMKADPERMWQIQCTDLTGARPQVNQLTAPTTLVATADGVLGAEKAVLGLPGLPWQVPCNRAALPAVLTSGKLRELGADAYDVAMAYIALRGPYALPPRPGSALPRELVYGFILRSRDPACTGVCSDVLLESPLLARIRKIVYERAPRSVRPYLTPADRLEHNAMRAFLTANEREAFLALYPEWKTRFQHFKEFTENVVLLIITVLRQRALDPASCEPAMRSATGDVARALIEHIARHENLAAFQKNTESIVRDYVLNPVYAFLFLRALQVGSRKSQRRSSK